jgi:DNA-binding XRE family transcriptional regulator
LRSTHQLLRIEAAPNDDPQGVAARLEDLPVTPQLKKRRRDIIKGYCLANSLTRPDLARRVGVSLTAIYGIANEDRERYAIETRDKFLKAINVSLEQWYGR